MIQYSAEELEQWGQKHMDKSRLTIVEAPPPPKAKRQFWGVWQIVNVVLWGWFLLTLAYIFLLGFIGLAHQLRAWLG